MALYLAIAAFVLASVATAQRPATVPFDKGLVLTWASSMGAEADWESRVEVVDSTAMGVTLRHSWSRGSKPGKEWWRTAERDLFHQIREVTRSFYSSLGTEDHSSHLASTFLMVPVPIATELNTSGRADVEYFVPEVSQLPYTGTLTRVGVEPFSVVFNDSRVNLRAVRVTGTLENSAAPVPEFRVSFVLLDDPVAPWLAEVDIVRANGFRGHRVLTRVSYHANLEADLAARCRATTYDIHFATASAEIDPASSTTFATIANALNSHRDWRITIVGHTDSIGASTANLALSRRRAEAARLALVNEHGVNPARIRAEGRGEDRPIEDNGTLAGRARNRRVELVRDCR